jgi:hypothetical protein
VHRMALFSGRGDSLGWNYVHPTEGVSSRPNYSSTYKNISFGKLENLSSLALLLQLSLFFGSILLVFILFCWPAIASCLPVSLPVHCRFSCIELEELSQHFI